MTTKIILNDRIRPEILKILSGYWQRHQEIPKIYVLTPWISDLQLEIDAEVLKLDESWFGLDYGILSINLAYAILLVKLVFGTEINIVTHDPAKEEKLRGKQYSQTACNLLDFLDEIGCRIFFNSSLHSTLILSNDKIARAKTKNEVKIDRSQYHNRSVLCARREYTFRK